MEPTPSTSSCQPTPSTSLSEPTPSTSSSTEQTSPSSPPTQGQEATGATRFTFNPGYDIIVLKEAVSINPWATYGLKGWQTIVDNVARVELRFQAARARTVRDRVLMLLKKHKADDMANLRRSGTEEQYEEREMLLTELLAMMEEQSIVGRQRDSTLAKQGQMMREAAMRGLVQTRTERRRVGNTTTDNTTTDNTTTDNTITDNTTPDTDTENATTEAPPAGDTGTQDDTQPVTLTTPTRRPHKRLAESHQNLQDIITQKRRWEEEEREHKRALVELEKKRLEAAQEFYHNEERRRQQEREERDEERRERREFLKSQQDILKVVMEILKKH